METDVFGNMGWSQKKKKPLKDFLCDWTLEAPHHYKNVRNPTGTNNGKIRITYSHGTTRVRDESPYI